MQSAKSKVPKGVLLICGLTGVITFLYSDAHIKSNHANYERNHSEPKVEDSQVYTEDNSYTRSLLGVKQQLTTVWTTAQNVSRDVTTTPIYDNLTTPAPRFSLGGKLEDVTTTEAAPKTFTRPKLILLWTRDRHGQTFWTRDKWGQGLFVEGNCPFSDCALTGDRSRVREADLLFFNFDDPPEWPEYRSPHQLYVHRMIERPSRTTHWIKEYDGRINLTLNYRQDADISLYKKLYFRKKPASRGPYVPRIPLATKTHPVVWVVSNCLAESLRNDYVDELSKYVDVHVYGKCGNYTCAKTQRDACFRKFEAEYKFYLSFENVICADYVTEKFRLPLEYELIPIVLGASNYTYVAPPHSYIDVRDFETPRHLAAFLEHVGTDRDAYNAYFAWKQRYIVVGPSSFRCRLCEAAMDLGRYGRPAHEDYYDWWYGGCDNDLIPRMRRAGNW